MRSRLPGSGGGVVLPSGLFGVPALYFSSLQCTLLRAPRETSKDLKLSETELLGFRRFVNAAPVS